MSISASMVKELRDKTNAGMMDCKKALGECGGDMEKAVAWLRQKGLAVAAKRGDRVASEGQVASYIHMGGKMGVMVEINCETDFTGKTPEFSQLASDIAMHIAATNPLGITEEDIPADVIAKEREIYMAQAQDSGKPANILEKIIEGKMKKFLSESCLLKQAFVKDPDKTVEDLINEMRAKTGENIQVRRFARFALGEVC